MQCLKAALCNALSSKLEMFVKREKEKNEIERQKQVPKFFYRSYSYSRKKTIELISCKNIFNGILNSKTCKAA